MSSNSGVPSAPPSLPSFLIAPPPPESTQNRSSGGLVVRLNRGSKAAPEPANQPDTPHQAPVLVTISRSKPSPPPPPPLPAFLSAAEESPAARKATPKARPVEASPDKRDAVSRQRLQQLCLSIVNEMRNLDSAWPFAQPIDADALGIPEYYTIIKKPMDLSTVRKQLTGNKYTRLSQFVADVRLIWKNCLTFNNPNSEVCDFANELSEWFESRWHDAVLPLSTTGGGAGLENDLLGAENADVPINLEGVTIKKNDTICFVCEQIGQSFGASALLCCDGPCARSFHLSCIGLRDLPSDEKWFCPDCTAKKFACMLCGVYGPVSSGADAADASSACVFKCTYRFGCNRFYHAACVLKNSRTTGTATRTGRTLKPTAASFVCPSHVCHKCDKTGTSLDLLPCFRCTSAFHSACLPDLPDAESKKRDAAGNLKLAVRVLLCSQHVNEPVAVSLRVPPGVAPVPNLSMTNAPKKSHTPKAAIKPQPQPQPSRVPESDSEGDEAAESHQADEDDDDSSANVKLRYGDPGFVWPSWCTFVPEPREQPRPFTAAEQEEARERQRIKLAERAMMPFSEWRRKWERDELVAREVAHMRRDKRAELRRRLDKVQRGELTQADIDAFIKEPLPLLPKRWRVPLYGEPTATEFDVAAATSAAAARAAGIDVSLMQISNTNTNTSAPAPSAKQSTDSLSTILQLQQQRRLGDLRRPGDRDAEAGAAPSTESSATDSTSTAAAAGVTVGPALTFASWTDAVENEWVRDELRRRYRPMPVPTTPIVAQSEQVDTVPATPPLVSSPAVSPSVSTILSRPSVFDTVRAFAPRAITVPENASVLEVSTAFAVNRFTVLYGECDQYFVQHARRQANVAANAAVSVCQTRKSIRQGIEAIEDEARRQEIRRQKNRERRAAMRETNEPDIVELASPQVVATPAAKTHHRKRKRASIDVANFEYQVQSADEAAQTVQVRRRARDAMDE